MHRKLPLQVDVHYVHCTWLRLLKPPNKAFTSRYHLLNVWFEAHCVRICLQYPVVLFLPLSLNIKMTLCYAWVLPLIVGQFVNGLQIAIKKMKPKQTMVLNMHL